MPDCLVIDIPCLHPQILKPDGSKDIAVGTPVAVLAEEADGISAFKDFNPEGQWALGLRSCSNRQLQGLGGSRQHALRTASPVMVAASTCMMRRLLHVG